MKKNKKIAIPLLCLKHHGGIRVVVEIANEISKTNEVSIITPKKLMSDVYKINPKVKLELIDTLFTKPSLVYIEFIIKLMRKLRKYDLYIANFFVTMFPIVLSALIFKKEYLYVVQDIESKREGKIFAKIFNKLCELTYKSNYIVTANNYLKSQIEKRGKSPIFNFTVGVDNLFFEHPAQVKVKKYDIIYFARSQKWKNFDMFLEFLSVFNKKELSVAVISQEENLFDRLLQKTYTHNISCIKPQTQTRLIETMDLSKIFVGTSKKEGFYLPAIEAMSRGIPVLLYPNGGSQAYFNDGENGRYFFNTSQLCQMVLELLDDKSLYDKYSSKSKDRAQKFNMQVNIKKVADFISAF